MRLCWLLIVFDLVDADRCDELLPADGSLRHGVQSVSFDLLALFVDPMDRCHPQPDLGAHTSMAVAQIEVGQRARSRGLDGEHFRWNQAAEAVVEGIDTGA